MDITSQLFEEYFINIKNEAEKRNKEIIEKIEKMYKNDSPTENETFHIRNGDNNEENDLNGSHRHNLDHFYD